MESAKKLLIIVLSLVLTPSLYAQYTSNDNFIGSWDDDDSWVGNSKAPTDGSWTPGIIIQGYITRDGHLTIANNSSLTINDTLWITGNLTVSGGATLTVSEGGLLIVEGKTDVNNGAGGEIDGIAVFMKKITIDGASPDFSPASWSGDYYGYKKTTLDGNNVSAAVPDESDLASEYPDLYSSITGGTLPIELLSFSASSTPNSVRVKWTTAMEENFDFFTLERAGADLQFEEVGSITGHGFSTTPIDYQLEDKYPQAGVNYYRLKATDLDGFVEYHHVINVWFESANLVQMYPNPVLNNQFTVVGAVSQIQLVNIMGHTVLTQPVGGEQLTVDLPQNIKPGNYIALVSYLDGSQERRSLIVR